MAPTIQVSVQVPILFCLVAASMGGIKGWQKEGLAKRFFHNLKTK